MRSFVALVVGLWVLGVARTSLALGPDEAPDDELVVSLLTFGPGDYPFTKFGHNGLLVEDRARGTTAVYNYGTFSFRSIGLVPKFLLGKYRYWLSVQGLGSTLATYAAENRSVVAEELLLSADEKRTMVAFLEWNARDENKYYVFDYYRDNCATRIRDLVDKTTGGALARVSLAPAAMTWRGHTERLSADDVLVYIGLYIAMGNVIDRPIRQREEMFLPAKLAEGMERAGLVGSTTVLVRARREPVREAPPRWTLRALAAGVLGAAFFALLGRLAARDRRARAGLGVAIAVVGAVFGVLGSLFVFLWTFTNHEVAYHNENILQLSPIALALVGSGVAMARGRADAARRARRIALAGLGGSALGVAAKILPWFSQENALVVAFALPVWAGIVLALQTSARASL